MPTISISSPNTPEDFGAIRQLCRVYRDLLLTLGPRERVVVEQVYPAEKYSAVLQGIEVNHMPPRGAAKLARP